MIDRNTLQGISSKTEDVDVKRFPFGGGNGNGNIFGSDFVANISKKPDGHTFVTFGGGLNAHTGHQDGCSELGSIGGEPLGPLVPAVSVVHC